MEGGPEARLTVIGSGTLFPSATRSSASLYLVAEAESPAGGGDGAGTSLLFDCGWGTLHALARHGVDWEAIDGIALTHFHDDHASDLPALLAAWRQSGRTRALALLGPPGIEDFLRSLAHAYGEWMTEPGFPLEIVELAEDSAWSDTAERIRVQACPAPHTDASVALRASGDWGRLGYTGDTAPSAEVTGFLAGCDLLVAECALPDPPPFEGHLTPVTLAELVTDAEPGLVLVTHVYPPIEPQEMVDALRTRYAGRCVAARDGMTMAMQAGQVTAAMKGDA
jgi:ribonuclease BN (tRNA processing enzyme)